MSKSFFTENEQHEILVNGLLGEVPKTSPKKPVEGFDAEDLRINPKVRLAVWSNLKPSSFEHNFWKSIGCGANPWLFRSQVPLGPYIMDLFSQTHMICIELDGPHHDKQKSYDNDRDMQLEEYGIRTLRFNLTDFNTLSSTQIFDLIEHYVSLPKIQGRLQLPGDFL